MAAVLVTEFAFEMSRDGSMWIRLLAYAPFLLMVLLFQPVGLLSRFLQSKIGWTARDRYSRTFSGLLLLAIVLLFLLAAVFPFWVCSDRGLLFGVYLLLCVWQIESPHIDPAFKAELNRERASLDSTSSLWQEIDKRRKIARTIKVENCST